MGDFNLQLTSIDRSSKQKIIKEAQVLNNILDQMNLIDIYRACHPKAAEYTVFSNVCRIFSRIDHILDHKASLDKFKKTEIVLSIFCDCNTMKLEMNCKKKALKKSHKIWSLENIPLNND